jgi:hypothetical protein
MTKATSFATLAAVLMLAGPASAQGPYNLETMNFDLWCQETRHLPPERCDKRLASDEADFEAYRAKVEKYEIPYYRGREKSQQLNRVILHNDPVDNPVSQDPAAAQQLPTSPKTHPEP